MRIRTLFGSAALAALLVSAPAAAPALAQEGAPAAEASSSAATATQPAAPSAEGTQALRRTAEGSQIARPPRTLRAYWHVFIAFALAWVLLFGYVLSLGRRFRRLEGEVDALGAGRVPVG